MFKKILKEKKFSLKIAVKSEVIHLISHQNLKWRTYCLISGVLSSQKKEIDFSPLDIFEILKIFYMFFLAQILHLISL